MSPRLSRAEQNDRNRGLLFAAARRVFLARGYHAATLEQIADEAGFSKGVVYSRFASKADLFLALLEDRIAERAAQNAQAARDLAGSGDFTALFDLAQRAERAAPGWRLLVTEFRIHAARDPELNRRYAALHARTADGIARSLIAISERGEAGNGQGLPFPPRQLAELLLAVETGLALEQQASPDALGGPDLPVIRWLTTWLAPAPVLTREET
jgi:AcrR family transcriptional regulator